MCRSRYTSLADTPVVGYWANVLIATSRDSNPSHEQWMVTGVADDLMWVEISKDGQFMRATMPWWNQDPYERKKGFAMYDLDNGRGCTFTRVPEPGDMAKFLNGEGRVTRLHVETLEDNGRTVVMTGGQYAYFRSWGDYYWGGCRSVHFTPNPARKEQR